ncbi:hypothetical protein FOMPIDRAFT_1056855 [Fomitopsis schrenkii]|uniref:Uncharacterized protein n=1 Tax=Fomitopsis schrenkii TaxID=2126942 RepID=S8F086_FOMSC|nr:hypothetical protein FOMPIDRAFT_1056855 [Fomitopsis schrenkii]
MARRSSRGLTSSLKSLLPRGPELSLGWAQPLVRVIEDERASACPSRRRAQTQFSAARKT